MSFKTINIPLIRLALLTGALLCLVAGAAAQAVAREAPDRPVAQRRGLMNQAAAAQGDNAETVDKAAQVLTGAPLFIGPVSLAAIQHKLQNLGYPVGWVDGQWGRMTAEAVRKFQQERGLTPTGNLNIETIQTLGMPRILEGAVDRTELKAKRLNARQGTQLYIDPAAVRNIQDLLKQQGLYQGDIDGAWEQTTRQAVQAYEQKAGLPPTGQITLELIDSLKLGRITAALAGAGEPEIIAREQEPESNANREQSGSQKAQGADRPRERRQEPAAYFGQADPAGEGAPLYAGGPTVRNVQQILQQNGFDPGAIDGIWGSSTSQALMQFQQAHSLEPTGNLNIATARVLLGGLGTDRPRADPGRSGAQ